MRPKTKADLFIPFILSLVFTVYLQIPAAKSFNNELIADSLLIELANAGSDTVKLNEVFVGIRKNRRDLKESYIPLLEEYIKTSERHEYWKGKMQALDRLGLQKRYDEEYDQAIEYHLQSMEIAEMLKDSVQLSYNLNNLGQAYRKQDLNVLAIKHFHLALEVQEEIGDFKGVYFTQNTLGACYFVIEEFDKAYRYFSQALQSAEANNDPKSMAFNLGSMGEVYLARNMPDSAMVCFEQAKQLKLDANYDKGLGVTEHLIGQAHFVLGNLEEAKASFNEALQLHIKYNNKRYQALCMAYLGKIALTQNQNEQSFELLNQAKELAEEIHSIEHLILIEQSLFDYYKLTNKHLEAYTALDHYHFLRDQINKAKYDKNIQTLEIEYQTRQKLHSIELLSSENKVKTQQIQISIIAIIVLILSAFSIYSYFFMQKRHAKLVEVGLQHKLSRTQMNPHFVSNAMMSIQNYMDGKNTLLAKKYLLKFSQLNRSVLEHSMLESIPLHQELEMLENYLDFEKVRLDNSFSFKIEADENLDTEMIYIPPLFIQPFVENAVKHGIKQDDGRIAIKFTDLKNFLKVEILDNGQGFSSQMETQSQHTSRSLDIVKKRLSLLRKKYSKLPEMTIASHTNPEFSGVHVTIFLPII